MSKAYDHDQTVASASWTVQHNLNTLDTVNDIFINDNGNLSKMIPQNVIATDLNSITVDFTSVQTGVVRVIG